MSDYSPWEGWDVRGWPVATILRGKVIVENGKSLGTSITGNSWRAESTRRCCAGPPPDSSSARPL